MSRRNRREITRLPGRPLQEVPLEGLAWELHTSHGAPADPQPKHEKPVHQAIGRELLNPESISELINFLGGKLDINLEPPFLPYVRQKTLRKYGLDAHQLLDTFQSSQYGLLSQQPYTCYGKELVYRPNQKYIALNVWEDEFLTREIIRLGRQISNAINPPPFDVILAYPNEPKEVVRNVFREVDFAPPIPAVVELGELVVRTHSQQ